MGKDSNGNIHNIYNTISDWHNFKLKLVFEGIIVGILTGLTISLFRFILERLGTLLSLIYKFMALRYVFIPIWILILAVIGGFLGYLVKRNPEIGGSGIPQVEGVLLRRLDMCWWKVIIGKFVGGLLSIGAGLSLGREGPSVQLGAAIGQGFSRIFKRIKIEEKYLITSGASAGLAAAFNAPLAGAMFSLEEVHKNFSPLILLSSISAALSSDFITSEFFGLKPILSFRQLSPIPLNLYAYIVILGIIIGLFGVLFNISLLKTQSIYAKLKCDSVYKPIIPLLLSIALGFFLPSVLGGGHELIISIVKFKFTLGLLILIVLIKFIFTMVSYGSGVPGGIFLPLLTIGALIGNIYGNIAVYTFHINGTYIDNFIILAMAAYFAAVVRSPITGSLLITEMTGSFSHLLSLSIISIVAYIVADLLGNKPIYESLLDRYMHKNEDSKFIGNAKTKVLLEIAVSMGSKIDGKMVKEILWPGHCLLVGIKRGNNEIIPKGDTKIFPGDYLIALTDEKRAPKITVRLKAIANAKY